MSKKEGRDSLVPPRCAVHRTVTVPSPAPKLEHQGNTHAGHRGQDEQVAECQAMHRIWAPAAPGSDGSIGALAGRQLEAASSQDSVPDAGSMARLTQPLIPMSGDEGVVVEPGVCAVHPVDVGFLARRELERGIEAPTASEESLPP